MGTKIVKKVQQLSLFDVIKMQIKTNTFLANKNLSDNEMNALTLICIHNGIDAKELCSLLVEKEVFKSEQTVRNFLVKAKKEEYINRIDNKIFIRQDTKLVYDRESSILLNYQFFYEV